MSNDLPTEYRCKKCGEWWSGVHACVEDVERAISALPMPDVAPSNFHLNNHRSVAVSNEVYWNENMADCPLGVKVQLLGAGGVAVYAHYHGDPFWEAWAPLPKRRPK